MPLPTEIDAQSYLISVKEHFKDDTGEFAQFIQILNDFRSKTCDAIGIITRLKQLVKSHELLLSFNKFLPKGFEILCPSKDCLRNKPRFQLKETLRYIRKIKTRFQDEEYIRKGFCILGKCSEVVDEFNEIISQSTNGIAEMVLSHLEQCTPRYRLQQQNFPKTIASCSTGLDAEAGNPCASPTIQDASGKDGSRDASETTDPQVDGKDPVIGDSQGGDKPLDLGGGGLACVGAFSR
ncbi:hypothetical protein SUGI_1156150 [Cryptomeria japonica]|nr:hypothetical protein SUGI_1156150 [Cryptomeria japonica]